MCVCVCVLVPARRACTTRVCVPKSHAVDATDAHAADGVTQQLSEAPSFRMNLKFVRLGLAVFADRCVPEQTDLAKRRFERHKHVLTVCT